MKATPTRSPTRSPTRCSKEQMITNDVLEQKLSYKYPYTKLTLRQRNRRKRKLTCLLIAACFDSSQKKDDPMNSFFTNNKLLLCDVLSLLDEIRLDLQVIFKINVSSLSETDTIPAPVRDEIPQIAKILFSESSQAGYERMRTGLMNNPQSSHIKRPSSYQLAKNRPAIEPFDVVHDESVQCFLNKTQPDICINNTTEDELELVSKIPEYTPSSFITTEGNENINISDAYKLIESDKKRRMR